MTREEIEGVGFEFCDCAEMMKVGLRFSGGFRGGFSGGFRGGAGLMKCGSVMAHSSARGHVLHAEVRQGRASGRNEHNAW